MTDSTTPRWNQLKERGGLWPLNLMLLFYRLGGRKLCQLVLYVVIFWYWVFATHARHASQQYLEKLHHFAGEQSPFARQPNWQNSFQHLLQFGLCILDKMEGWLGRISEQQLQLHGHEQLRAQYQKGAIIVVSHFGNIELLRALKSEHIQKINVLVYQKHAAKFNQFLKQLNSHADISLLPVDELGVETAILLQEKLDQGEWVIVAADRIPVQSGRVQAIPFLGCDAHWPQGAWILASLLKVPVLAIFSYKLDQVFHVYIHQLAEQLHFPRQSRKEAMQNIMRRYVELLEQHCIRAPYQWFNFYHFWNK